MVTIHITVLCILMLSSLSHAGSIVKNLPGFHGDLPFSLETGYIGGGTDDEVQLFYYFVESERDPLHDPLILYLTGGPGATALYPLLFQIGPISVNYDKSTWEKVALELNPNSWSKTANVIYVDLPAGTGFSYATTYEAWKSSDSILAQQSYEFLVKWLEEHPRFLNNHLYVAGISYMGIIVPLVTLEVYKGNDRRDQRQLNIKGCLIVSPLTDKFSDLNSRFEFAHRLALISDDIYEEASAIYLKYFGNDKEVQKALHVREGTIKFFEITNETIHYNFKKEDNECYSYDIWSSIAYHKMLLSRNCQVLILSGDHDYTFPYVGAEQWITSLNLPIESPWNPWFVNNQVAGYQMKYAKNGYSLTYATVKAAGHSIALYKPEEAWVILDRWLASHSYLNDS